MKLNRRRCCNEKRTNEITVKRRRLVFHFEEHVALIVLSFGKIVKNM